MTQKNDTASTFGRWSELSASVSEAGYGPVWHTANGTEAKPLYMKEDVHPFLNDMKGVQNLLRAGANKSTFGWRALQILTPQNEKSVRQAQQEMMGVEWLLPADQWNKATYRDIENIASYRLAFLTGAPDDVLRCQQKMNERSVKDINLLIDILSVVDERAFDVFEESVAKVWEQQNGENVFFCLNTDRLHNSGATQQTALAAGMSAVVDLIELGKERDWDTSKLFASFVLRVSVTGHFFEEIASLRALRSAWDQLQRNYDVSPQPLQIFAETAYRTKAAIDEEGNLLRAMNEAFAAVVGGADAVTILPFDSSSKPRSAAWRYAYNMHVILNEEAGVGAVQDPAAGSYAVESLTESAAQKLWQAFLQLEKTGGFRANIENGSLSKQVEVERQQLSETVKKGDMVLVGVNRYAAEQKEEIPHYERQEDALFPPYRTSMPFEDLRTKAYRTVAKSIPVLTFGNVKLAKRSADEWIDRLGTIGWAAYWEQNEEEALENDIVILCGEDEVWQRQVTDRMSDWQQTHPNVRFLCWSTEDVPVKEQIERASSRFEECVRIVERLQGGDHS